MDIQLKVQVKGSCGKLHDTIKEWQKCTECAFIDGSADTQLKRNEHEHKKVWNAAIEAVAKASEYNLMHPEEIRKLKK